jgi:hypothetical protein
MSIAEKIATIAENVDKVSRSGYKTGYEIGWNDGEVHGYNMGYDDGKAEGGGVEPIINELTITKNGTYTAPDGVDGYSPVTVNVAGIDTSDATATSNDIDYEKTAYVNGKKVTGTKQRREYTGEITENIVGQSAYAALVQDDLLAEIRTLDTLFVRVESDLTEPIAYTVVKTWATNNVRTLPTADMQRIHRWSSSGGYDTAGNAIRLDSTTATEINGKVGLVNIAVIEKDDGQTTGELRWYSGSNGNFYIRKCNYKVIVEW